MTLAKFLSSHRAVGIDTNVLIYFIEAHPRYVAACERLFWRIERGQNSAFTSTLTLLEVLVQPYRQKDDTRAQKFYALLSTQPGLHWVSFSLELADRAAELRARYRLSTPDAMQLATTISSGCTGFVGNDKKLRRVREIECLILDEVTAPV